MSDFTLIWFSPRNCNLSWWRLARKKSSLSVASTPAATSTFFGNIASTHAPLRTTLSLSPHNRRFLSYTLANRAGGGEKRHFV